MGGGLVLTLSILVALGRFLGFLVSVTLTKLWKAGVLQRGGGHRVGGGGQERSPSACPPPPPSRPPTHHLALSFSLGG